jgi:uncharacterized protein (DUF2384 family)
MKLTTLMLIVTLGAITLIWLQAKYNEVQNVKSTLDGRTYLVRKLPDAQRAANELARLNKVAEKLIHHLDDLYGNEQRVKQLKERFNPAALSEGSPDSGYTSYSVGKGRKIVMCIRQSDYSFVPHNTLVYVMFHELAHVMTKTVGHDASFWANFRFILKEAVSLGLYRKVDYGANPEDFCGIKIASTIL